MRVLLLLHCLLARSLSSCSQFSLFIKDQNLVIVFKGYPKLNSFLKLAKPMLACAAGCGELQRHVWREVMALAAAALTAEDAPDSPVADAAASGAAAQQQAAGERLPGGTTAAGVGRAPAHNSKGTAHESHTDAAADAARRGRRFGCFMAWSQRLLAAATARVTPPLAAEALQLEV